LNNFGLGSEFSTINFSETSKHIGITSKFPQNNSVNNLPLSVDALDQLEILNAKINIMKIDVEGMEIEVLEGARVYISRSTEKFLCILEKNSVYNSNEMLIFNSTFSEIFFRTLLLSDFGRLIPLKRSEIAEARGHLVIVSVDQLPLIADLLI
jgi:hypothetical protein